MSYTYVPRGGLTDGCFYRPATLAKPTFYGFEPYDTFERYIEKKCQEKIDFDVDCILKLIDCVPSGNSEWKNPLNTKHQMFTDNEWDHFQRYNFDEEKMAFEIVNGVKKGYLFFENIRDEISKGNPIYSRIENDQNQVGYNYSFLHWRFVELISKVLSFKMDPIEKFACVMVLMLTGMFHHGNTLNFEIRIQRHVSSSVEDGQVLCNFDKKFNFGVMFLEMHQMTIAHSDKYEKYVISFLAPFGNLLNKQKMFPEKNEFLAMHLLSVALIKSLANGFTSTRWSKADFNSVK